MLFSDDRRLKNPATIMRRAARALLGIGVDVKSVVPCLAEALKADSSSVRLKAAMALEIFGAEAKSAVPALLMPRADGHG